MEKRRPGQAGVVCSPSPGRPSAAKAQRNDELTPGARPKGPLALVGVMDLDRGLDCAEVDVSLSHVEVSVLPSNSRIHSLDRV